jgi:signal transduction histidine kinase/DNA-binding NarL/FixJ family response regulator
MAEKILVAEDDPEARELLLLLLGGGDYHLLQAADGVEALELIRSEQPDLLITDIVMPRMDGYELVRKLRQDERASATPVIFCSASYHEREVREMARNLGVFSTLAKPYDLDSVHPIVEAALTSRISGQRMADAGLSAEYPAAAQERLNALVAYSRRLFTEVDPNAIVSSACHAARDILLSQYAELVFQGDAGLPQRCHASGLSENHRQQLLETQLYRDLLMSVEAGGFAQFPLSTPESATSVSNVAGPMIVPGSFVSMLGVPVASATQCYGYLCVVNRIGLKTFTDEDLGVARAIAAQVAVAYENAQRHRALAAEIEQRRSAEELVRRLNTDLERRVAERTVELQSANRELEAFSYSVAHDLRAPLRLIDAHVQMLRDVMTERHSTSAVKHADNIQRGAAQMSGLIDGLLALSRVRHIEMKQVRTSLSSLVKQTIEYLGLELDGGRIDWRLHPLPTVRCDPELMLQVLANLIGNAVKYTRPRAQPVIEIGTDSAEDETFVYVRDNGVGFDMQYAAKLFGVFQRLHRQDEFEGTGIGLATVSRIIERHGGRIWAQSTLGEGAEFRFTLGETALGAASY